MPLPYFRPASPCAVLVAAHLLFGVQLVAEGARILDGSRWVIATTSDSHHPTRHLPLFLERYFGKNGPIVAGDGIAEAFGRGIPVLVDGDKLSTVQPDERDCGWLAKLPGLISGWKSQYSGHKIAYFAYMSVPMRKVGNSVLARPDCYLLADTTDKGQIDRAVAIYKYVADEIKKAGADVVFLSTTSYAFLVGRLVENNSVVVREFNRRYSSLGYYAVDIVGPTLKEVELTMGADRYHPTTEYGWYFYASEYFRALLRNDAIPEPAWVDSIMQDRRAKWMAKRNSMKYLGPQGGKYGIGDTVVVRWEAGCEINASTVEMCFSSRDTLTRSNTDLFKKVSMLPSSIGKCPANGSGFGERTICCTTKTFFGNMARWGEVKWVVDSGLFNMNRTQWLAQPIPAFIQLVFPAWYPGMMCHSGIDLAHPENMITLYPWRTSKVGNPVYPRDFTGLKQAIGEAISTGALPAAAQGAGRIANLGQTSPEVWSIDGRRIDAHSREPARGLSRGVVVRATSSGLSRRIRCRLQMGE